MITASFVHTSREYSIHQPEALCRRGQAQHTPAATPCCRLPVYMGTYAQLFAHAPQHYAQYRPSYPAALIQAVLDYAGVSSSAANDLAVDVATGSGQAAVPLAAAYQRVLAIDGSPEQLAQALAKPNIQYCVADAHAIPTPDHSADLVTVAQALHW